MRKIMIGLMNRQLRDKFVAWKMNSDFRSRVLVSVETVVKRREARMKRIALLNYKDSIRELKREIRAEGIIK